MKPSSASAAAPTAALRQREAPSPLPAPFWQPGAPSTAAGVNVASDRGRPADTPAPQSESGKFTRDFQKAAPPALETPAVAAVTSPQASTPHALAFAARLVERPAGVNAGDGLPAEDPKAQTQTSGEAVPPPAAPLPPASSEAATHDAHRTLSTLLPEDQTEPAPPLPPPAKPEDPHPASASAEQPAPGLRREDTDNSPSQPKVVRQESAENLQTAGPHGPASGGAAIAGFDRPPAPARADPSAPAEPGPAAERANPTAQALSGSAPQETSAASPAQNISVRLTSDGHPALEVRIMERGGEVRVAVHSPDPATSESVRSGLPELVDRLGQRGYETEIWHPPAAPSSASARGESDRPFGRGGQQDRAGQEQQQPRRQPQPAWLEELDNNLNPNPNRSTYSWRP